MKPTLVLPALAALALAQPHAAHRRRANAHGVAHQHLHEKRGVHTEWVTETAYVTQTVYIGPSTTKTYAPGETHDANANTSKPAPEEPTNSAAEFYEPQETTKQAPPPKETVREPAPYVEPPKDTPAPSPSPSPKPSPSPEPSPEPVATSEAPSSGGGGGGGGEVMEGDITYFELAMGACGFDDSGRDSNSNIVALSAEYMGAESNGNPLCGKKVTVTAKNGKTATATVRDKISNPSEAISVFQSFFLDN